MELKDYYIEQTRKECVFCKPSKELILDSTENFILLLDPFALTPGHLLLTSKSHYGCLGEVPKHLYEECSLLRWKGCELLRAHFSQAITRYEHGRAGHCISRGQSSRSCHHYHEHLIPKALSLHTLLEQQFKAIAYEDEMEIIELFNRYHEYLLVCESNEPGPKGPGLTWEGFRTPPKFGSELPRPKGGGFKKQDEIKKFYVAKTENVSPHLLRTLTADALGTPELHDWEAYTSCEKMLAGKEILSPSIQVATHA